MMMPRVHFGEPPSRREQQVAIELLFGRSRKQAARNLGITVKTVDSHMHKIHVKYGAHICTQLVRILMGSH